MKEVIQESKLTDEDVLNSNPEKLSSEDFNRWKTLNKRRGEVSQVYSKNLILEVEFEELNARLIKAKRDRKVHTLEIMKAFVETEEYIPRYTEVSEAMQVRQANLNKEEQAGKIIPIPNKIIT